MAEQNARAKVDVPMKAGGPDVPVKASLVVTPATPVASKAKVKKTEYTSVVMSDGRTVQFPGSRKVLKSTLIDESKVKLVNGRLEVSDGAVQIQMDFRNGATRKYPLRLDLFAKHAGHGGEQKYGDELAAPADKPMSFDDMLMAVDDLHEQLYVKGDWTTAREGGGGFAGAGLVVRAIVLASEARAAAGKGVAKTLDQVKAYLQKKLDDAKAKGEKLSRKELYDSFRNPNSETGKVINRLEAEELSKTARFDADAELEKI